MTRKHYILLADWISRIADLKARELAATAVANACHSDNSRFDAHRFFTACKVTL